MTGKSMRWILGALATRLSRFGQRVRDYENDPEMVQLLRQGVGLLRENTGIYHEVAGRLFVADDVNGVPQCLIDVSDRSTIRWLYQKHLRRHLGSDRRRPLVIDLGANDGFIGSMSLNFVQLGWDAILVEPLPEMMALARRNLEPYRMDGQRVLFIEAALGPSDGESAFETEISRDISRMEGHLVPAPTATSRTIPVISVESLLARNDVSELIEAARPIVLSVDIEGPDLMVATRILECGIRPHFIIFETIRCSPQDLQVFERHGYERLAKIGWNGVYGLSAST
ncbi:MAG: FkbM family methyltransferase [Gemmatimonadaceae bacterium]|nr:FkbM family methyltransferase [Gemmatimonadaceae bacterium]NUO96071.1 FkbM family methyltransferase [Gemmatimonadaceae bacterium]NUP57604.1 FkbM family methyltransferase [Gemmatimonadaceae bacterium]NUR33612.1 FkbM family methyltransferase [Gemmatimonadaceae bacterium]NUS33805.1 FkbM family methyltransferase [Gemmatimonadaceae bacterium]